MENRNELRKKDRNMYLEENVPAVKLREEKEIFNIDYNFNLDESKIKYEFNLIELPFFSKDKKVKDAVIKNYVFSEKYNSYMRVIPSSDPFAISNKILQEFDEQVFYAILELYNIQQSDTIITDYFTLAKIAKISYKNQLNRLKDSLQRLQKVEVELNNIFYSTELKNILNDKVSLHILDQLRIIEFRELIDMPNDKQSLYRKYFRNSKIKEIIEMRINDYILRNMKNKGFLYFDTVKLLQMNNATARKLYILLVKWQGWEKKQKIKRSCKFLASRIPLSWHSTNVPGTIRTLNKACSNLKDNELIKGFKINKTKPLYNSYIEFEFFDKGLDREVNLSEINKILVQETGQENLQIEKVEDMEIVEAEIIDISADDGKLDELRDLCSEYGQMAYEVAKGEVNKYNYDIDYLLFCFRYTFEKQPKNPVSYFRTIVDKLHAEFKNFQLLKEKKEKIIEDKQNEEESRKQKEEEEYQKLEKAIIDYWNKLSMDDKSQLLKISNDFRRESGLKAREINLETLSGVEITKLPLDNDILWMKIKFRLEGKED